jgi:Na+/H+-dicarboxylate symporter
MKGLALWMLGSLLAGLALGALWLNGLTMTVVPLVFGLIVVGVGEAAQQLGARSLTARSFFWFAVLLVAASALGAMVSVGMVKFAPPNPSLGVLGEAPAVAPAAEWLSGLIPSNPIKAAAETAMAPLVLFSLIFGFAVARIESGLRTAMLTVVRALVDTMLVIVGWVLWLGPAGVLALAFLVGARAGAGAASALAFYILTVAAACLGATALAYVLAITVGRLSPLAFARGALPSQTVALSTQSSLASLPAMIEGAAGLEVEKPAASLVLPLAVSVFRAASVAANIAVAVYLAHLHGVALTPAILTIGVLVAAVISIAAVGLPAQVSFFTTIAPICLAMGVPVAALPILLAVETVPDIFRTVGNVTADLAVARIVSRRQQVAEARRPVRARP